MSSICAPTCTLLSCLVANTLQTLIRISKLLSVFSLLQHSIKAQTLQEKDFSKTWKFYTDVSAGVLAFFSPRHACILLCSFNSVSWLRSDQEFCRPHPINFSSCAAYWISLNYSLRFFSMYKPLNKRCLHFCRLADGCFSCINLKHQKQFKSFTVKAKYP